MPYNLDDALLERSVAVRGGRAARLANQGMGKALFGVQDAALGDERLVA